MVLMAQVEYKVKVKGIECSEPICFQPNSNSGITNVEINCTDCDSDYYDMSIKLAVDNDSAQVEEFVSKILNVFSYRFGMLYKNLMKTSDSRILASGAITIFNNSDYHVLSQSDSAEIINDLGNQSFENDILGNPYVSLLLNSLRVEGDVGRFIQLYGLLQIVVPTKASRLGKPALQEEVNAFITDTGFSFYDVNEDKPTTRPGKTGNDTIYTWLRNQVGHTATSTNVADVQNQIEAKVNDLFFITKKAIENYKL
ncbi:hypothetical protein bcere0011_23880 [Bacillus cereus m1550]|nr:hypothetical protein bcere0011_23880 [Bacillus cereus m1550]